MELLRPGRGLAPLEEQHAVGAAADGLVRPRAHLSRRLRRVLRAPVHGARRLLHEDPRRTAPERSHEVAHHRRIRRRGGVGRVGIGVVRDDVDLLRPRPVVHRLEEAHEVRRDRHRRARPDHLDLGPVAREQLVAREAVEVEQLGRVAERRRGAWRHDLLERVVSLRPERRAPGAVELLDRAVPRGEPLTERRRRHVAVAVAHVASVLVVHVPQLEGRMPRVPLHQSGDQLSCPLAVHGRARAVLLATADGQPHAALGDRQRLRMPHREPGRR